MTGCLEPDQPNCGEANGAGGWDPEPVDVAPPADPVPVAPTVYRKPNRNLPLIALWLLAVPAYFVAGAMGAVVLVGLGLAVPAMRHEDFPKR